MASSKYNEFPLNEEIFRIPDFFFFCTWKKKKKILKFYFIQMGRDWNRKISKIRFAPSE